MGLNYDSRNLEPKILLEFYLALKIEPKLEDWFLKLEGEFR